MPPVADSTSPDWDPAEDLATRLARVMRSRADAVAIETRRGLLSAGALQARARRWARHLQTLGAGAESRVGLDLPRSPELVVAILACLRAGAAYVPLDAAYPAARKAQLLRESGARWVIGAETVPLGTVASRDAAAFAAAAARADAATSVDASTRADAGMHAAAAAAETMPVRLTPAMLDLPVEAGETRSTASTKLPRHAGRPVPPDPAQLAYVIFTSGSTGSPKGVAVTRGGLSQYLRWAAGYYPSDGRGVPLFLSPAFDLSVTSLFLPLLSGEPMVIVEADQAFDAIADALAAGRQFGLLKLTPSHLRLLRDRLSRAGDAASATAADAVDAGAVNDAAADAVACDVDAPCATLIVGGEQLERPLVHWWHRRWPRTRIFNEYGPTETVVGSTIHESQADEAGIDAAIPIGLPIDRATAYIVDRHGRLVDSRSRVTIDVDAGSAAEVGGTTSAGVEGELLLGGPGVARGYLDRPDRTAERFVPDAFGAAAGARLYRTGDRVRRAAGLLHYLGRADQQVKVRGYRIELAEIEAALQALPGVTGAVVLATETDTGDRTLTACVTCSPIHVASAPASEAGNALAREAASESSGRTRDAIGHTASATTRGVATGAATQAIAARDALDEARTVERLRRALAEQLPDFMVPARIRIVPAIPITPGGKLDRAALDRLVSSAAPAACAYQPPRNPVEEALAAIWAQVLGVPDVGIDDNFFSLGGDSMRSLQVRYKAAQRGLRFELKDLFEANTVRRLAARVTGGESQSPVAEAAPFALLSAADRGLLPDAIEDAYPLSRLQASTLYHSSLPGQPGIYHNINSYRVRVPWDERVLRAAADRLAARHAVLRSSYNLSDFSEPMQLVHATARIPVTLFDLRGAAADDQQLRLRAWMDAEARHAFRWERPPLLRFFVHRFSDDELQFSVSKHHSILDGWSAASMVSELFNDYLATLAKGGRLPAEPPAVSYRGFVALEREALRSASARAFWQERLAGYEFLRLGRGLGDTPAPDFPSGSIVTREVAIDAESNARLVALAVARGVPLKHVLLAAHVKMLAAMSGQRDIVTGLVSNGRPEEPGGERTLGLFLNSVPFRIALGARESWTTLVDAIFDEERRLFPFRRYPMSEIKRDLGGSTLFDTLFYFTNFHVFQQFNEESHLQAIDFVGYEETEMRFTSAFNVHPLTRRLKLFLHFRVADFGTRQIDDCVEAYATLLRTLAADPGGRHTALALVNEEDARRQRVAWNGSGAIVTDVEATPSWDGGVVADIVRQMASCADALAIQAIDGAVTYGTLARRSAAVARWLQSDGANAAAGADTSVSAKSEGTERVIGVAAARSPDTLVALLGVLRSGAAYVMLDPSAPAGRLRQLAEEASLAHVLTDDASHGAIAEALASACVATRVSAAVAVVATVAAVATTPDRVAAHGAPAGAVAPTQDETTARRSVRGRAAMRTDSHASTAWRHAPGALAYVMFTSGSTGRPKGVMVSHANLTASTRARRPYYGGRVTRFLLVSPLFVDSAVAGLFWTWRDGGCIVLPASDEPRDGPKLAARARTSEVTHLLCLPTVYGELLAGTASATNANAMAATDLRDATNATSVTTAATTATTATAGANAGHATATTTEQIAATAVTDALEIAIVAGEACRAGVVAAHAARHPNVPLFNEYGPTENTVWSTVAALPAAEAHEPVPIGRAIGPLRACCVDAGGDLLPAGAEGELLVSGAGVARGYWRQPSATAARFVPDGWTGVAGARAYRTGDIVRWRGDGQLLCLGRRDDEVKVRGYRVSLGEIAAALRRHAVVADAAALLRPSEAGPRLLACVVLAPDTQVSGDALRQFLRQQLPEPFVPAEILCVDALPTLPNGKLDRRRLLDLAAAAPAAAPPARPPETPVQIAVAAAWGAVLGRDAIGLDDDFFESGGDSIVALQLAARLRSAFPVDIGVRDIFESRTVAALSAGIAAKAAAAEPAADESQSEAWSSQVYPEGSTAAVRTGSA